MADKVSITPVGRAIGRVQPGEELRVAAHQARALVAMKRARYLLAEMPVSSEPVSEAAKPKRHYRRRDMAAET